MKEIIWKNKRDWQSLPFRFLLQILSKRVIFNHSFIFPFPQFFELKRIVSSLLPFYYLSWSLGLRGLSPHLLIFLSLIFVFLYCRHPNLRLPQELLFYYSLFSYFEPKDLGDFYGLHMTSFFYLLFTNLAFSFLFWSHIGGRTKKGPWATFINRGLIFHLKRRGKWRAKRFKPLNQ